MPTPLYDEWLTLAPARRLIMLIDAWLDAQAVPLMEHRPEGVPVRPTLTRDEYASVASGLRLDVLRVIGGLPSAYAMASDGSAIAAAVRWARPVICGYLQEPVHATDAIRAEATMLGLIGRDALSPLGARSSMRPTRRHPRPERARLSALDRTAAALTREATSEAIFQADLTIVVPGTPTADVARLLDSVADRESRGSAGTWRCSAGPYGGRSTPARRRTRSWRRCDR